MRPYTLRRDSTSKALITCFGPDHHLSVVTVGIAFIPAVSVWVKVSWIRLDDGLDPRFVQNALGFWACAVDRNVETEITFEAVIVASSFSVRS